MSLPVLVALVVVGIALSVLASSAVCSAFIISGCAVRSLSSVGFKASASCSASIRRLASAYRAVSVSEQPFADKMTKPAV